MTEEAEKTEETEEKFRFPDLHDIPQECILQHFCINDLMHFYSFSPATEGIVRRLRMELDLIALTWAPAFQPNLHLSHTRRDMPKSDYLRVFVLGDGMDMLRSRNRGRPLEEFHVGPLPTVHRLNTVPRFWNIDMEANTEEERMAMYYTVLDFFMHLFRFDTYRLAVKASAYFRHNFAALIPLAKRCDVTILRDDAHSLTREQLLTLFEHTPRLLELAINCRVEEGLRYERPLAIRHVVIPSAQWLDFSAILQMTSRTLHIAEYDIQPPEHFNELIRRWQESEGLHNVYNLNIMTRERFPAGYKDLVLRNIHVFVQEGVQQPNDAGTTIIRKKDGKRAVLEIQENMFTFVAR